MRNRRTRLIRQEAKIYEDYYRPSFNPWRFLRSIVGVLVFGRSTVAETDIPIRQRMLK